MGVSGKKTLEVFFPKLFSFFLSSFFFMPVIFFSIHIRTHIFSYFPSSFPALSFSKIATQKKWPKLSKCWKDWGLEQLGQSQSIGKKGEREKKRKRKLSLWFNCSMIGFTAHPYFQTFSLPLFCLNKIMISRNYFYRNRKRDTPRLFVSLFLWLLFGADKSLSTHAECLRDVFFVFCCVWTLCETLKENQKSESVIFLFFVLSSQLRNRDSQFLNS